VFSIDFLHFKSKYGCTALENNSFTGIEMMVWACVHRVRAEQG
jgi:hypothetical protein